jgi:preprotein translocase SecE subunit
MAKQDIAQESKPNVFQRVRIFLEEVWTELGKVTWPSFNDLKASTRVTMYMLGIMGAIIFLFDRVFDIVMRLLLSVAA